MVAMNRMIGSWLTRWRRMNLSTMKAKATMTATVSRIATTDGSVQPKWSNSTPKSARIRCENGTWPDCRPTSVIAAKSAMTPWA